MPAFAGSSLLAICAYEQAWPRAKNRRQAGSYRGIKLACAGHTEKNRHENGGFCWTTARSKDFFCSFRFI
jgi:hypothetical protein